MNERLDECESGDEMVMLLTIKDELTIAMLESVKAYAATNVQADAYIVGGTIEAACILMLAIPSL